MAVELFNDGRHIVHAFYDLVDEKTTGAVQCNQFLIVDNGHGALIDPGGTMTYTGLLMDMQKYFSSKDLDYIFASHPDPDIIASVNKWFVAHWCCLMQRVQQQESWFLQKANMLSKPKKRALISLVRMTSLKKSTVAGWILITL